MQNKKIIFSSLVLFNTLEKFRSEVVCIYVSSLTNSIISNSGIKIKQQIGPIFYSNNGNLITHKKKFEVF